MSIIQVIDHVTCNKLSVLIRWNYSIQTGKQILLKGFFWKDKLSTNESTWIYNMMNGFWIHFQWYIFLAVTYWFIMSAKFFVFVMILWPQMPFGSTWFVMQWHSFGNQHALKDHPYIASAKFWTFTELPINTAPW